MFYTIAGHNIEIDFDSEKLEKLLPSFLPFRSAEDGEGELLFRLTVDNELKRIPESECHLIRDVDTGNGKTRVD